MKTKTSKITTIIIAIALFLIPSIAFLSTTPTHAANSICGQSGVSKEIQAANGCDGEGDNLGAAVTSIINTVIGVLGIVATIFILTGGINYMTSNGEATKIEKAKKTILWATIGLVIAALTFVIVNFVIGTILKNS